MGTVLVVLPTYNEHDNLTSIVPAIRAAVPEVDIWIVDDNSPDGTGEVADSFARDDTCVTAFHRAKKSGLGTAYAESFQRALDQGYAHVVEMDSDFSHDPAVLPELLAAAVGADLVLGSRYVPGGSTPDWSLPRQLISKIANVVARMVLSLRVHDATTGYRVFSRKALLSMHLSGISLQGYGFQIETVYQCQRAGLCIVEHPIRFIDRSVGHSKMSTGIVLEALVYVFRRRFDNLRGQLFSFGEPGNVTGDHQPAKDANESHEHIEPKTPTKGELSVDNLEGDYAPSAGEGQ